MTINVTLTFATPEEVVAFFAARVSAPPAPKPETPAPAPTKPAPSPKPEAPGKSEPAATAAATSPAAPQADAPAPQHKQEGETVIERATVSKLAVTLATRDKGKAIEILSKFGAKGVKDVPDDKLAECHKLLADALGA